MSGRAGTAARQCSANPPFTTIPECGEQLDELVQARQRVRAVPGGRHGGSRSGMPRIRLSTLETRYWDCQAVTGESRGLGDLRPCQDGADGRIVRSQGQTARAPQAGERSWPAEWRRHGRAHAAPRYGPGRSGSEVWPDQATRPSRPATADALLLMSA